MPYMTNILVKRWKVLCIINKEKELFKGQGHIENQK